MLFQARNVAFLVVFLVFQALSVNVPLVFRAQSVNFPLLLRPVQIIKIDDLLAQAQNVDCSLFFFMCQALNVDFRVFYCFRCKASIFLLVL